MKRTGFVSTLLVGLAGCGWADLRPDTINSIESTAARDGAALAAAVARAHGVERFETHSTVTIVGTDDWEDPDVSWWPHNPQPFRADRALGTFSSRVALALPDAGTAHWGIQNWRAYRGQPARFVDGDPAITFYLPSLQYFDELPFRIANAEYLFDAGIDEAGRSMLFATWGSLEASGDHDQYLIRVDPETKRVHSVTYTIRDAAELFGGLQGWLMPAFAVGTLFYGDYRSVDGVWFAFDQCVVVGEKQVRPASDDDCFHRLAIDSIEFDRVPIRTLVVDEKLGLGGDHKPNRINYAER